MENRTSTYLMYDSSHDKNIYRFIQPCFQVQACQWDIARAGWNTSKPIGQRDWSRRQQEILPKIAQAKVSFFLKTQKRRVL